VLSLHAQACRAQVAGERAVEALSQVDASVVAHFRDAAKKLLEVRCWVLGRPLATAAFSNPQRGVPPAREGCHVSVDS
jgi:hypothetical protein